MDWEYNYNLTDFPNDKCDLSTFEEQIRNSTIKVALDYLNQNLGVVSIFFKAELDTTDQLVLDNLVANHSGDPGLEETQIVKSEVLTEHIKWVEQGDTTQGLFAAESLTIDLSTGQSEKTVDFSWPFVVALMSGTIVVSEDMVGDEMNVHVGPNTLIGACTQPINVGDTSIYVSPTVMENIKIGYFLGLYVPGDSGIEISQVKAMDTDNSCLGLVSPSDVSANVGSYVAMCAKLIPNLRLHSQTKVEIGKDLPTGQRIPANLPIRVNYKNNNQVEKTVTVFVEYLY